MTFQGNRVDLIGDHDYLVRGEWPSEESGVGGDRVPSYAYTVVAWVSWFRRCA